MGPPIVFRLQRKINQACQQANGSANFSHVFMDIQGIALILGGLSLAGATVGLARPDAMKTAITMFPRNRSVACVLTALCCLLGAREAYAMNMGGLSVYKPFILVLTPAVFVASIVYLKELLAARTLGGLLCLLSVPITRTASLSGAPYFQVVSAIAYVLVVLGISFLLSPWNFRKLASLLMRNDRCFRRVLLFKGAAGAMLILLALLVY